MSRPIHGGHPEHLTCDVLVVGYGPVGMISAALLAQLGVDVIAVERYPDRYKFHRAGHLDGETMRTFQRLGIAEDAPLGHDPHRRSRARRARG